MKTIKAFTFLFTSEEFIFILSFIRKHIRIQPENFLTCKELLDKIKSLDKVVIVGFPKTGKTTISLKAFSDREIIHTDDFIEKINWKDSPKFIINFIAEKSRFVLEGVQAFRVLRTGNRDETFKADAIIYLKPKFSVLPEHVSMRKTLDKIWKDFLLECRYSFAYFKAFEDDFLI